MSESALKTAAESAETPRWEEDALGFLIAPVTPKDFLENHYEQKALIDIRDEPERYADLLTLESLDHFLNSADLREGMVDLTNHQQPDRARRLCRRGRPGEPGRARRANICAARRSSCRNSTNSIFNLGEFCRALEEVFTCHVQTNIYLTPRSIDGTANQGFPPHYDNHDVFVMQISGAKAWRIYGTPVATPFRGEQFEIGQHEAGEVDPDLHAERRRLPLYAARRDARRRECRRRALAAHHRRADHQDLGGPAARIDLRAGAGRARFPPLASRRLRRCASSTARRRAPISTG